MEKKNKIIAIIVISLSVIGMFVHFAIGKANEKDPIYQTEYNRLTVEVLDVYLTADEDNGKAIAHIKMKVINKSDHGFIVQIPHFFYNETEHVPTFLNLKTNELDDVIGRETTTLGTVTITMDTRDLDSVKTLHPTITIYDRKTEEEKEIKPELVVSKE